MGRIKNLVGQRFGQLEVISQAGVAKDRHILWLCRCDCGNEIICGGNVLKSGNTRSCGCFQKEGARQRQRTHGLSGTKLYNIYYSMLARCYNSKNTAFVYYGKRGIKVCKEWKENLLHFVSWSSNNGYKEHLTLDRIDNDGDYTPENCRWITMKEQSKNKRKKLIDFNNEKHSLKEWSVLLNIPYATLHRRLKHKWPIEKAFTTPVPVKEKQRIDKITFNGETKTQAEWCRELNIPRYTLSKRITQQGWSVEKAMTTPIKKKHG